MEQFTQIRTESAVLGTLLLRIAERYKGRLHCIRPMGGRRWVDCLSRGHGEIIVWYEELLPSGYTSRIETIKLVSNSANIPQKYDYESGYIPVLDGKCPDCENKAYHKENCTHYKIKTLGAQHAGIV